MAWSRVSVATRGPSGTRDRACYLGALGVAPRISRRWRCGSGQAAIPNTASKGYSIGYPPVWLIDNLDLAHNAVSRRETASRQRITP